MKKYLTLILPIALIGFLAFRVYAQDHSSNTVKTKVGNPPAGSGGTGGDSAVDASSCPIPNGTITCGSQNVPVNGCGHCGIGYEKYPCDYEGLHYAMDIGAGFGDPVYLPLVNGANILWSFSHQSVSNDSAQAIQYYGGTDEKTGEQYWIQFHHTQPGSGGGTLHSGEKGANVCQTCNVDGSHVHIEFAKISDSGQKTWQDAPNYFCSK